MSSQMVDALTSALIPQLGNLAAQLWWFIPAVLVVSMARSAWFKGLFGEWIVNRVLSRNFKEPEYSLFKDVMLPTEDGSTQIDHILVSRYGLFVIETKNMKGWIFGDAARAYWTQQIFKKKFKFQNPLRQNYKHTRTLCELIEIDPVCVHSVIVFVGAAQFKTVMPDNVLRAFTLRRHIGAFRAPVLEESTLATVKTTLSEGRLNNTLANKRKHVAHVQSIKGAPGSDKRTKKPVNPAPTPEGVRR